MTYEKEIEDMVDRIVELTDCNPLDPVMTCLMTKMRRVLERRGFHDGENEIASYFATASLGRPWLFPKN